MLSQNRCKVTHQLNSIMKHAVQPLMHSVRMTSRAVKYQHAKLGEFTQIGPILHNPFKDDPLLERTLRRLLPSNQYDRIAEDLERFGSRIVSEIDNMGRQCELNEPKLEQHDMWGKRVDKLIVCPEWNRLKQICAEEGLISIGYDPKFDPVTRRIHQIAKLYLFSPSAGLTTCPMAMTDGAVKTLQALNLYGSHPLATEAIDRLQSRDGKMAWTSGQWMTEKKGGSDVGGGCETYAEHIEGDKYRLFGYKWFSSAVDADIALTLARVVDDKGNVTDGSRGLSLFLLKIRNDIGDLNGIQMIRLKNKLGTRQLPTAELLLDGTIAHRISNLGRGVADISNMLNITRIHNAVASISGMRRIISVARDYATRRIVFGQTQAMWPLHTATIAKMEIETRGCFMLLMEAARLIGISESGKASEIEVTMLRLITPVLKLYAGKMCVPLISEGLECFGGMGYIEDTGLPTGLRDAQVTPIWEGTTNVLSLDVLRVLSGKDNVMVEFHSHIESLLSDTVSKDLAGSKKCIQSALSELKQLLATINRSAMDDSIRIDACARQISFAIAKIYSGALLIQNASHSSATLTDVEVAHRWCVEQPLVDVKFEWFSNDRVEKDKNIVFENFTDDTKSKL